MAIPVAFREFTPRNSRDDLMRRLERAPEEHVEALLSAYDLLQKMHEKGLIDIANGLLGASDTVIDKVTDLVSSAEIVNALRAVLMFANLLEPLDTERMRLLLQEPKSKPPSIWSLGREAMSEDARMGLATAVGLLNVFGAALRKQKSA
jgi:uncharacterized protein YjgD (DUF1641 family)